MTNDLKKTVETADPASESKADAMRQHADNCADMADDAKAPADKARYKRMETAWNDLAETQDWLDGNGAPQTATDDAGSATRVTDA